MKSRLVTSSQSSMTTVRLGASPASDAPSGLAKACCQTGFSVFRNTVDSNLRSPISKRATGSDEPPVPSRGLSLIARRRAWTRATRSSLGVLPAGIGSSGTSSNGANCSSLLKRHWTMSSSSPVTFDEAFDFVSSASAWSGNHFRRRLWSLSGVSSTFTRPMKSAADMASTSSRMTSRNGGFSCSLPGV